MSSARHEQVTSQSIGMFWCGDDTSGLTYLEMTPARASQMSPRVGSGAFQSGAHHWNLRAVRSAIFPLIGTEEKVQFIEKIVVEK